MAEIQEDPPTPVRDRPKTLSARARYQERLGRSQADQERADALSRRIAQGRLGTFLAAFAALVVRAFAGPGLQDPLLWSGGLLVLAFLALVGLHGRARRRAARAACLHGLSAEALARLDRDWDALPEPPETLQVPEHPYAADLDLFGRASLLHLLSPVSTVPGRKILISRLLEPASPGEIHSRQEAVAELAPMLDLRDELAVQGRLHEAEHDSGSLKRFLEWADAPPWSLGVRWLGMAAWILPALTLTLIGLQLAEAVGAPWWALPLGAQLLVLRSFRRAGADLARASAGEWGVRSWVGPLEVLAEAEFSSPRLRELRGALTRDGVTAADEIRRLSRLVHLADARLSFLYPLLNPVLLWDVHVQRALDRWRKRCGGNAAGWLDALGRVEALSGLAALRFDNPEWCAPEVFSPGDPSHADGVVLRARDLGHPLIPPGECVRNDLEVGPPGTFLLVTGSNMSGKSTLLRAIGVNTVLAQAGGPVCATELRLPAVRLWTSMRVQDSLARGVSQFMAELQRLREVVTAAASLEGSDRAFLYLLDEILQGTNTAERRIAARRILRHLLGEGALGAVTTHDLTLADAPDLNVRARMVHFRETIRDEAGPEEPHITFDYRLRPGLATSTNALALMELVGLGEEGEEPDG